jgi:2-C-methyl-D-erythritol 4-phosphate cytidylyltransferase
MNIAIILAGGRGTRLEKIITKQFFKIAGDDC